MTFKGLTIAQLQSLVDHAQNELLTLVEIQQELLERKARKEKNGKNERGDARSLRLSLLSTLIPMLSASPLRQIFNDGADCVWVCIWADGDYSEPKLVNQTQLMVNIAQGEILQIHYNEEWHDLIDFFAEFRKADEEAAVEEDHFQLEQVGVPTTRSSQVANRLSRKGISFTPTEEQNVALQYFRTGDNLKINAFAGSGKTSTLLALSHDTARSGFYLAYNKAIVVESRERFPGNVECRTAHSLARSAIKQRFRKAAKLNNSPTPNMAVKCFNVPPFNDGIVSLKEKHVANLAIAIIKAYTYSRCRSLSEVSVPLQGTLSLLSQSSSTFRALTEHIHQIAEVFWNEMKNPKSTFPLGHDGYLKLWSLETTRLATDYIFVDEAQDMNDAMLSVLERQDCQVVYVGDKHQQLYEWRGAVNALDKIECKQECYLSKSFRFGTNIAALANTLLLKLRETRSIVGNGSVTSRISKNAEVNAVLGRTNAAVLNAVVDFHSRGKKVYIEGGVGELKRLVGGVYDLINKEYSTVPEFFGFTSWQEVVEFSETEAGKDLETFVRLVNTLGHGNLYRIILSCQDATPETSDITISTTHKAKGREWRSVQLLDDFAVPEADESGNIKPLSDEDNRVLYVAVTRAKEELSLGENVAKYLGVQLGP